MTAQCCPGIMQGTRHPMVNSVDLVVKGFQWGIQTNKQAITITIWCDVCYDR